MNQATLSLTVTQLKAAVRIREKIDALEAELAGILGSPFSTPKPTSRLKKRREMSAAGRRRIAAAQKARWSKLNGKSVKTTATRSKRKMSAPARAKMADAAKKRWAAAKAAGKSRL